MARPVRKKRVPRRFEDAAVEKSPVIKETKRVVRDKSESKKSLRSDSASEQKRSSASNDKSNVEKGRRKRDVSQDGAKKEVEIEVRKLRSRPKMERKKNEEENVEARHPQREIRDGQRKESKMEKETQSGNKFFKTKKPLRVEERRVISKRGRNPKNKTERNDSLGFITALRQTTLSESFGRGARAKLRPRNVVKEDKDATNILTLLERSISPDKRNSIVLLERFGTSKPRKPIYKTINAASLDEDKDSIYDFRFDSNDPMEKPKKKRVRRAAPKKKKLIPIPKPKPREAEKKQVEIEKKQVEIEKNQMGIEQKQVEIERSEIVEAKDVAKALVIENKVVNPAAAATEPENTEKAYQKDDKTEERSPQLRISNVERLTGDRKVSFKPKPSTSRQTSVTFNPFRSTQSIFRPRPTLNPREMIDHSLLNKSLSPIKGEQKYTFDAASPWRPPVPEAFFRVRQVVQSTPQIKRNFGRPSSPPRSFKIDENDENQENAIPQRKLGLSKSPTPLGVRTSNAENIQASNPKKVLGLSNVENKQNLNPGFGDRLYKSPKKSDKILTKRSVLCAINEAPLSPLQKTDENIPPMEESRFLKQSNLNNFLNIDEMPESIRISTSHGIFGDAHSTPAIKARVLQPQQDNVENFFGFDDDENSSDAQVTPIKEKKQRTTPVKKIFDRLKSRVFASKEKNTARISLGEIKNTLYPRKEKKPENNNLEKKEEEEAKSCNNNKKPEEPVKFSDTFDVMLENGSRSEAETTMGPEIALFADIEPIHFTKPPRWSYSKKRDRKQYWSDEEGDDNEDFDHHKAPVLKKRRVAKVNKIEEKKIDDWVKSVNETFQEIDDFDLVVEKLP